MKNNIKFSHLPKYWSYKKTPQDQYGTWNTIFICIETIDFPSSIFSKQLRKFLYFEFIGHSLILRFLLNYEKVGPSIFNKN